MTVLIVGGIQTVIAGMQIRGLRVILTGLAVNIKEHFFSAIVHIAVTTFVRTSMTIASGHSSFRRLIAFLAEIS
jgi:hypothetical protein